MQFFVNRWITTPAMCRPWHLYVVVSVVSYYLYICFNFKVHHLERSCLTAEHTWTSSDVCLATFSLLEVWMEILLHVVWCAWNGKYRAMDQHGRTVYAELSPATVLVCHRRVVNLAVFQFLSFSCVCHRFVSLLGRLASVSQLFKRICSSTAVRIHVCRLLYTTITCPTEQ